MLKLNKTETKIMEIIERYQTYTAVSSEIRRYKACQSLVAKGLLVVTVPEEFKTSSYYQGKRETWYQFSVKGAK